MNARRPANSPGPADHPESGSCDLPDAAIERSSLAHRKFDSATFTWDGVPAQVYKHGYQGSAGMGWSDVVRHTLACGESLAFQLRYFEIGPGGFSSLEKHQHAHTIIVLRGSGRVIAGREVFAVGPFDLVVIPAGAPHQFVTAGHEPFGFLCPVDADRDAPQALTPDELESLLQDPDVRSAVRLGEA
ncbi:MAG: cupin domain-containing protein, partial [bacterium]